jgi:hypothetical protein
MDNAVRKLSPMGGRSPGRSPKDGAFLSQIRNNRKHNMKRFIGYYIIGSANKAEAFNEKGLMLWSQSRPSVLQRFFNRILLGIYWVDREKILEKKQDSQKLNQTQSTDMPRYRPAKQTKYDHTEQRRNTDKLSS